MPCVDISKSNLCLIDTKLFTKVVIAKAFVRPLWRDWLVFTLLAKRAQPASIGLEFFSKNQLDNPLISLKSHVSKYARTTSYCYRILVMLPPAIRPIVTKGTKGWSGRIQLLCHVKPGVSAKREGIVAVTDEYIEVRVAAQAREGEANKAVREVIAEVCMPHAFQVDSTLLKPQAFGIPKSNVDITKGAKSRQKTVMITNYTIRETAEEEIERIKIILNQSLAN